MPSSISNNRLRIRVPAATPPPAGGGNSPPWVAQAIANGWQVGTWARVSGPTPSFGLAPTNVIQSVKTVNPGDANFFRMLSSWTGGALAPALGAFQSCLVGVGGAHSKGGGGYEGNDVFRFDIGSRVWSELRAATPDYRNLTGNSFGEFPDGSPLPTHTYFGLACTGPLPGYPNGLLIMPRSVSNYDDSTVAVATRYPHWLDLANPGAGWVRGDAIINSDVRDSWAYSPTGLWDPVRRRYVLFALARTQADNLVASLDPTAAPGAQWTFHAPDGASAHYWYQNGIGQSGAYDPIRDIFVLFDYRNTDTVRYLKANALNERRTTGSTAWLITELGTPPVAGRREGAGVAWSTTRNAIIYWPGDFYASVFEFKYESGTLGANGVDGSLAYRWTNLTSGANTITPSSHTENPTQVFNKFTVASYADGAEVAFSITDVNNSVDAFLISAPT